MKVLSVSEAKIKLSRLVEEVDREGNDVIITRNGRPAAVLISPAEYESRQETQEIRDDPELMNEIRQGLRELAGSRRPLSFADVFGEPVEPHKA